NSIKSVNTTIIPSISIHCESSKIILGTGMKKWIWAYHTLNNYSNNISRISKWELAAHLRKAPNQLERVAYDKEMIDMYWRMSFNSIGSLKNRLYEFLMPYHGSGTIKNLKYGYPTDKMNADDANKDIRKVLERGFNIN
ncbi:MAG: hypothetical protein ACYDCN_12060, partial [Bacteroidia bacterium]